MKTCPMCKEVKDFVEFSKNSTKSDGLQTVCKLCKKKTDAKHYQENKKKQQRRNTANLKKYKTFFNNLKNFVGCIKCSENDSCCLDFHHFNDDKDKTISQMLKGSINLAIAEAKKCVVICSNCHRKLHANKFDLSDVEIRKNQEEVGKQLRSWQNGYASGSYPE